MSWTFKAHNILMSFVPSSILLPNTGFRVLSFCNFDKLVCCCSIKEGTVWTKVRRRVCWPTHLTQVPAGNWRCNGVLQAGALHGPEYSGSWITGAWKAVAYQGFCKELWVPVVEVIQVDSGSRLLLKSLSFFFMGFLLVSHLMWLKAWGLLEHFCLLLFLSIADITVQHLSASTSGC